MKPPNVLTRADQRIIRNCIYLLMLTKVLSSNPAFSQQHTQYLFPFEDYTQCLYGIKDIKGKVLFEPQFARVLEFRTHGNYNYLVLQDEKFGLLDSAGNYILPCEFQQLYYDQGDRSWHFRKDKKSGVFDSDFNIKLETDFEGLKAYIENDSLFYQVYGKNGIGLISKTGE